jgi:hypothetical protein
MNHRVLRAWLALASLTACAREAEPIEEVAAVEVTISADTAGSERVGPVRTPTTNVTFEGAAGGPVEASSMRADCTGWLPSEPQYVLEITSPEDLSLTATTQGDAVLLVAMPDGTMRCDDDTVGFNPRVTGYFAPGRYPVFVGTWAREAVGTPFELVIGPPVFPTARAMTPSTRIPGVPIECGMAMAAAGPIHPGTTVVLGAHSPYDGNDPSGAPVTADRWWNDDMWPFVGMTATVNEVALDPIGCPYVRVDVDGGTWGWRIRDLGRPGGPMAPAFDPRQAVGARRPYPPFTGVGIDGVPADCGMTVADYGPIEVGMSVVLGAHTPWSGSNGRAGTARDDTWWNEDMWAHTDERATITELGGLDPVGCPYVRVDVDGGIWGWRIRDLRPPSAGMTERVGRPGELSRDTRPR